MISLYLTVLDKSYIWQWNTNHTSIFIVTAIMDTYAPVGAVNESVLIPRASDIIQDNSTTTLAIVCTIPCSSIFMKDIIPKKKKIVHNK